MELQHFELDVVPPASGQGAEKAGQFAGRRIDRIDQTDPGLVGLRQPDGPVQNLFVQALLVANQ